MCSQTLPTVILLGKKTEMLLSLATAYVWGWDKGSLKDPHLMLL